MAGSLFDAQLIVGSALHLSFVLTKDLDQIFGLEDLPFARSLSPLVILKILFAVVCGLALL
jgi:hypothetical protein